MRLVARLLLLALAAALAWRWGPPLWSDARERALRHVGATSQLRDSDAGLTFLARGAAALEFPLHAGQRQVRVITNANVPAASGKSAPAAALQPLAYTIEYTLLDANGRELRRGRYHLRSRLTLWREADGTPRTTGRYIDPALLPLDSQNLVLGLGEVPDARTLRLRVVEQAAPIADIGLRCYQREPVPDYRVQREWQRMSREQREKAARGNVYGAAQLRDAEIRNLIVNAWQPVAPRGVAGVDYVSRVIYMPEDTSELVLDLPTVAPGLPVGPEQRAVLILPAAGARLRLQWAWLAPTAAGQPAEVRWYGEAGAERTWLAPGGTDGAALELDLPPGLVEASAPVAAVLRAFALEATGATEITPEPTLVRAYPFAGRGIEFAISHAGAAPTPFRLDLRGPVTAGAAGTRALGADLELLDAQGHVLATAPVAGERGVSLYDRVDDLQDTTVRVSDELSSHFELPAEVARVRVLPRGGDASLLANAYTRPADLVRTLRVPEDGAQAPDDGLRQPLWFSLQPVDAPARMSRGDIRYVTVQPRPPVRDPLLAAGTYAWDDLVPLGRPLGRALLTPRESGAPARVEQLMANFRPLPANRERDLDFIGDVGATEVAPTLLCLRGAREPAALVVEVDGQPVTTLDLPGRGGRLRLPTLTAGRHRLRVVGPTDTRCYVNQLWPEAGDVLRRFAYRFTGRTLVYEYQRRGTGAEALNGRLYAPAGYAGRIALRVSVAGPALPAARALPEWTPRERRYDILPERSARVPVLETAGESTDAGRAFFLPFAAGMPAGRYRITVTREAGPASYLVLAQLTPGRFERRSLQRAQESRSVEFSE